MVMKKYIFLVLFGLMTLGVNAQCKPCVAKTFHFNTDGNQEGWSYNNLLGNIVVVSGGKYEYTLDGTQASPNIRRGNFKTSEHQYFHVFIKNESNADVIRFNFKDPANPAITVFLDPVKIATGDSGYKEYIFNPGGNAKWNSDDIAMNLRFGVGPTNTGLVSGKISIDKIVVDNIATPGL
jgi:hypothetical protein